MPLPLIAALAPGIIQGAMGLGQMLKGQSDASKLSMPKYQIPDEIKAKLTEAQSRQIEGLPDASKKLFIDNMQRASAFGLRNLSSRQAGIQGLSGIVDAQTQQARQLAAQDAQQRLASQEANRAALGAAQSEMAGYRDKAYQINELTPYQQKAQAAQALIGAGLQNIGGGITSGLGAIGQKNYLDALMGKGAADKTQDILNKTKDTANQQGLVGPTAPIEFTQPDMGSGSYSLMGPNLPGATPTDMNYKPLVGPEAPYGYTSPLQGTGGYRRLGPNLDQYSNINSSPSTFAQPIAISGLSPSPLVTNPYGITQSFGNIKEQIRQKYPAMTDDQINELIKSITPSNIYNK